MSTASDLLALYIAAEEKILAGQAVTLGDLQLTMANLAEVRKERQNIERRVAAESRQASGLGGPSVSLADFSS